jgi:hypothetical protein
MMKTEIFLSGHPDGRSPFFCEGDRTSSIAEHELTINYRCTDRERLVFLPGFD